MRIGPCVENVPGILRIILVPNSISSKMQIGPFRSKPSLYVAVVCCENVNLFQKCRVKCCQNSDLKPSFDQVSYLANSEG